MSDEKYSDEEAARRRDELARRILKTPPQPRKPRPSKAAKQKPKGTPSK